MTVAEQERERSRQYRRQLPLIIQGLREGLDQVELADRISRDCGFTPRETYQWVRSTEDAVDRYRRRRAVLAVIPIWIGGAALVGGFLLLLQGASGARAVLGAALGSAGLGLAGVFFLLGRRLRREVYEKWLRREESRRGTGENGFL